MIMSCSQSIKKKINLKLLYLGFDIMDNILEALFSSCFVKEGMYSEWRPHISIFKFIARLFKSIFTFESSSIKSIQNMKISYFFF
jgi:hypothetical protein